MKRLKANKYILRVLHRAKPKLRNAILKYSDDDLIKTMCEISKNTLNGNTQLSSTCKKRIKKYKKDIRMLACNRIPLRRKRKFLIQKGGFLPVLLGTILTGIIGKLIES